MEATEHIKLIYQLSRIHHGSNGSMGLIYPKSPMLDISKSYNIWAKRAYKKGYLNLVEETSEYRLFSLSDKGLELLKKFKNYYLQTPNSYDMYISGGNKKSKSWMTSDELKRQRRRERRRLRKLRGDKR